MAEIVSVGARFDASIFEGASCAFGVFDGLHCGHVFLLGEAMRTAGESAGKSIALTFDKDPDELFSPDALRKLSSNEERVELLAQSGVDAVVVLRFSREFASAKPQDFLQETFGGHAPSYLHVGADFRFGSKASGTVDDLARWASGSGCTICSHKLVSSDGLPISATRIRQLLAGGQVEEANGLLGRAYSISGEVVPGRGEGAGFGFATANLQLPPQRCTLGPGVYAGYACAEGNSYRAAIACGEAPTFREATANLEVHILDFDGDLYGKRLEVQFCHLIRPMMEFASTDELVATVLDNIAWAREHLPEPGIGTGVE